MGKRKVMTEDERIAFEEQKRLEEEEMRKMKEDVLAQFLKDKLAKEEKATRYNLNKLNHQWRNIMREAKAKELKKDIEIMSQEFERVIDRKDALIKSLAKDITEAEEQYAMVFRSNLQNVDNLIEHQNERLHSIIREYSVELEIVCEEFDLERAMIREQHSVEMNDIEDIIFAMMRQFEERENEATTDFYSLRDDIRNKNQEDKERLRGQLEAKVDDLWQQFRQSLQNYNETNEEKKKVFESLKLKDQKNTTIVETQMRKIQRILRQIKLTKGKISANKKACEETRKVSKEEDESVITRQDHNKMLRHFQELKAEMNQVRDKERENLTKLTVESNAAIKELKRQKEKGELILRLSEMCRKLETEEEKVLPFYVSSLTQEDNQDVAVWEAPSEPLAEAIHEYSGLENFWKRYNKVLLDKFSLDKEKQTLSQENHQLRSLLKQYLDGISVNDEILNQVNPLIVANNKSNVIQNVPADARVRRPVPRTVIEASHIIKNTLKY